MAYPTFDSAAKSTHVTLSGGDLTGTPDGTADYLTYCGSEYLSTGKLYCEFTFASASGFTRGFGLVKSTDSIADGVLPINAGTGVGYSGSGNKTSVAGLQAYGSAYNNGDVVSMLWDADAGTVIFWLNGVSQGTAFTGITGSYRVAVSGYQVVGGTINFGASAFAYTPTAGYAGWVVAGPPTPGNVAVDMEPMTAYAARLATVAVTMEPMTSAGAFNGFGDADMAPMTVSASGGNSSAAITMQAMTSSVTGHSEHRAVVDMVAMTAVATGYDSSINTVAATIPAPTLSCSVIAGEVITFAGTVPAVTLESHTKDARLTVPAPTLSATLLNGSIITVSARVAAPVLVATLVNPAIITVASTVPLIRLSASLAAGNIATAILELPKIRIAANALTGNVATVLASVATPIMAAAGYPAYTITFAGTVPAPRLSATLSAAVTSAYRTWVLNTKKSALTEYSNFEFNSYCVFNGNVLAAGSNGIVVLGTQSLDNSTAISSTVTTGQDSFGSSLLKRVPRIYVGHTAAGDLRFATITTEGGTRRYALDWNRVTGTQQRRVPIGKGPKSRYWQFSLTNVDGADFSLNDILAFPAQLRRRVQ